MHVENFPQGYVHFRLMRRLENGASACVGLAAKRENFDGALNLEHASGDDGLFIEEVRDNNQLELADYAVHRKRAERVEALEVPPAQSKNHGSEVEAGMRLPACRERRRPSQGIRGHHGPLEGLTRVTLDPFLKEAA